MTDVNVPFDTLERQRKAAEFGIWIFLASEVLFFGCMFMGYTVYRYLYPTGFEVAGAETDLIIGAVNTALLLTSSATMAVAVWSGRAGFRNQVIWGLLLTALLGVAFMVLKAIEYYTDFSKSLIPGSPDFPIPERGAEVFFSFYWLMTAVHAVHLTIGVAAVCTTVIRVWLNRFDWRDSALLHVLGLYWHLIDLIWIVLFPLLYLLGR